MASRTPIAHVGISWSERQIRQNSAGALRHAVRKARATHADAAQWCRVSERTIRDWITARTALNLRAVLRSGRLRREFIRYLQVCDRKESA